MKKQKWHTNNSPSDELTKSHTRSPEHGFKKDTFRDILNLFVVQNNTIETNYIKANIVNTL